ncbi:hypothetical protein [Sphingomonas xinjiangensis]|uniref:ElaB/YqjD/DUF883 family membrane-anchored ribosome-binding protein n=1 Tax=Sphingomonas xinjiangensis TaxID=643568 RepID=A0A840YN18_9SPHN|nr:hypothetical protein [Sphingomonas xinjiangensis]MBB5709091.1 ElaB/YqjD/DUF883 family membrane-anchored ribosome-binding protein [Sphingomonas xinjiangensis]
MSNGTSTQSGQTASQTTSTTDKARQVVGDLGDNPIALLAGGVALGVLVGVLLPRVAKERELLDPLGRTLAQRATAAAQAAKEAGRQEIDALIPDKDATKERVSAFFGTVTEAAKGAAQQA